MEISAFYVTFCVNNSLDNIHLVVRIRYFQLILLCIYSSFYLMLNTLYKFQELLFWSVAMSWITHSFSSPALCHQRRKLLRPFPKMPIRGIISHNQRGRLQHRVRAETLLCVAGALYLPLQSHQPKPPPKTLTRSQNKSSVLAILTELYDKSLFLGQTAVPGSLFNIEIHSQKA